LSRKYWTRNIIKFSRIKLGIIIIILCYIMHFFEFDSKFKMSTLVEFRMIFSKYYIMLTFSQFNRKFIFSFSIFYFKLSLGNFWMCHLRKLCCCYIHTFKKLSTKQVKFLKNPESIEQTIQINQQTIYKLNWTLGSKKIYIYAK